MKEFSVLQHPYWQHIRPLDPLVPALQPHFTLVFLGCFPVQCPAEVSPFWQHPSTMASALHHHQDLSGLDPSAFPLCSCQRCRVREQPISHPSVTICWVRTSGPRPRSIPSPSSVFCSSNFGLGLLLDITRHHELGPLLIYSGLTSTEPLLPFTATIPQWLLQTLVPLIESPGYPADNENDNDMQWAVCWEPACSGYFAVSVWVSSSN